MTRLNQNHRAKEKTEFLLFGRKHKSESFLFTLLTLFLPTQLGKHFWPSSSIILGARVDYLSPTLYLTDIFILGLFLLFLKRAAGLRLGRGYVLFFVFLTLGILASGKILGIYFLLKFLEFSFVAFYIAKNVVRRDQLQKIVLLFGAGILFEAGLGIMQYFNSGSLNGPFYFFGERFFSQTTPGIANAVIDGRLVLRPYGTFSHPNVLAGYLGFGMLLIVLFGLKGKKMNKRSFLLFALMVGFFALTLTLSRVAIFLLILLFCIIALSHINNNKQRMGLALVFFVLISCFLFLTPLGPRFAQSSFFEEAAAQRLESAGKAIGLIVSHPFLGVGLGGFLPEASRVQGSVLLFHYLQPVHNIYLMLAAETGVIGLLGALWFLKTIYFRAASLGQLLFTTPLLFILLVGIFDHYPLTLQQGQLLLSYAVGLALVKMTDPGPFSHARGAVPSRRLEKSSKTKNKKLPS